MERESPVRSIETVAPLQDSAPRTFSSGILAPGFTWLYFTGSVAAIRTFTPWIRLKDYGCMQDHVYKKLTQRPNLVKQRLVDNRQAIDQWRKRLWACIKAKGQHFDTCCDL